MSGNMFMKINKFARMTSPPDCLVSIIIIINKFIHGSIATGEIISILICHFNQGPD